MSDEIWPSLFRQLGFFLFECKSSTVFVPVGVAPDWFRRMCPAAAGSEAVDLSSQIPFLEGFLPEAEDYWAGNDPDRLRSGLCEETDESGNEYCYEVCAIRAAGRRFLLFELRKDAVEIREVMQKARQNLLDYQLLERTQRALEKSQIELRSARDAAEAATQAKSAFLAHMSHEIRTPMNAVLGLTGLVLNTTLELRQRELLEIVKNSSETLLTILNDILDFSKIESGKLDLEHEPFEIRRCLEEALDLFAVKAADKKLELSSYTAPAISGMVVGDVTRLRQVLVNLLGNAIKFTAQGEVSLTTLAAPVTAGGWEISFAVRDTGIGIPLEKKDRLFQSFSQADSSVTRKYGGTGLGLAICKSLVELMGGRIRVESETGVGCAFKFTITVQAAQVQEPDYAGRLQSDLAGRRVWLIGFRGNHLKFLQDQLDWWNMQSELAVAPGQAAAWMREGRSCDVAIVNAAESAFRESDVVALPRPLLELVPGGRISEQGKTPGVVQLSTPIKIAALHSALTGLLHPGRVAAGAARTVIGDTGAEAAKQDLRILLADDNPINQQVGQLILESMGYRADLAGNGVEVLDALRRQPYDVILMDVHMPEMDGWEASRRVRREFPGDLQPRIIAMTAGILEEEKEKCLEAGMEDFVSKPVRSSELKRALEKKAPKKDKRSATEASPDEPDFDPAVLAVLRSANRPGQRDLVEELLGVYRKMLPGHLEEIRQAADKRDWKTLEHAAHKLRGSSANLGANRIATVCTTLERLGKKGSPDGMDEAVQQLETLIAGVCSGKR